MPAQGEAKAVRAGTRDVATYDRSGTPVVVSFATTTYGAKVFVGDEITLTMDDAELRDLERTLRAIRRERGRQ